MRNTARLFLAALLSLIAGQALAECPTSLPANTVMGRLGIPAAGGGCQAIPFTTLKNEFLPQIPAVSPVDFGAVPNSGAAGVAATNQTAFAAALAASPYLACKPGDAFHTQSITVPFNTALIQNCTFFADGTYGANTAVLQVSNNTAGLIIDNIVISADPVTFPTVNGINLTNTRDATVRNSSLSGYPYPILIGVGRNFNTSILNNRFESGTFGRAIGAFSDGAAGVTATLSIASPMVVTKTGHGLTNGDTVIFYSTGALPTGAVAGRLYYVINSAANTFQVSETSGGAAINSSGSQSGTQSYTSNGPQRLTVSGNTIYQSTAVNSQGIVLFGASDTIISGNSILGSTHFGIAVAMGTRVSIVNNVVKNAAVEAIHTDSGINTVIANNNLTFDHTSADVGISISSDNGPPAINTLVAGNSIDSPSGTCIYVVGSTGATVQGNKLRNCNVGNSPESASIALDNSLTTNNTIGQNTIEDTLGFNAYQVGESNYTGGGAPSANYIAQQLGKVGATGYLLSVATTDTRVLAQNSPASSDTLGGFWFGASPFAKRDVGGTSVDLFDYDGTLVGSLGSTAGALTNWGNTTHRWSSRGYGTVFASLGSGGWNWVNVAAPGSPASGTVGVWSDSTDLRLHDKNSAGVIGTTVVANTGATNNFLTAISAAGAVSRAQPAFTNISGIATAAQGGTGVNNGSSTITLGGNLVLSGAFATTLTVTGATGVTLPTSGTLAARDLVQTWSAVQSFNSSNLLLNGSVSGATTLNANSTGTQTVTLPAATDTLVGKATTDTLTNKTFNTASTGNAFTVNGVSLDTAWTSYSPAVTASSGAFTTVSATGFYKQVGKSVFVRVEIIDTTNGTAAGKIRVTLPVAVAAGTISQALSGFNSSTGAGLSVGISPADSTTQASIFTVAAGYPGANATVLDIQGVYEVP